MPRAGPEHGAVVDRHHPAVPSRCRLVSGAGHDGEAVALTHRHQRAGAAAEAIGLTGEGVEHRRQIGARGADGVEQLGHRLLPRERLGQVVEQTGVGDGDDGLVGERLQDGACARGERPDLASGQVEVAEMPALPHERDDHLAAVPRLADELGQPRAIIGREQAQHVVGHHRLIDVPEMS